MYSSPWSRASDAFAAKGKHEERTDSSLLQLQIYINRHKEEIIIPNWVLAGTGTTVPVWRLKMSLNFRFKANLIRMDLGKKRVGSSFLLNIF